MSNIQKFQYKTFDQSTLDSTDKEVNTIASSDYLKVAVGETVVRVLPAVGDRDNPFRVTAQHYIDALPGLDRMIVFACPRVELKQPCIACQKCEELARTGNPIDRERAKRMAANLRVMANVVDRNNMEAGPQVWSFGKQVWDQLKSIRKNVRIGGDFTDPTSNGFDLIILREGEERKTKYQISADRQASPLADTEEEMVAILSAAHDLDALVDAVAPEELFAAWGVSMRQQASARAAVDAQQPAGRSAAPPPPARTTLPAQTNSSRTVGSAVMDSVRQRQQQPEPAKTTTASRNALEDAEDDNWLDS